MLVGNTQADLKDNAQFCMDYFNVTQNPRQCPDNIFLHIFYVSYIIFFNFPIFFFLYAGQLTRNSQPTKARINSQAKNRIIYFYADTKALY